MARIVGPNGGMVGIDLPGMKIDRRAGAFDVPDRYAKRVAEAIGGGIVGTRIVTGEVREAPGPWCETHGVRPFFCGCPEPEGEPDDRN